MRIFVSDDRVVAEDLQTTNGSTLNEEPLVGVRDLPGDPELLEDPPPPPSPTPDPTDRVEGAPGSERCPECGEPARHDTDACVACGFIWPTPRPGVRTMTGRVDTRSTIERGTE